ncbi:MAG: hypothetical protein ACE5H1_01585, partial [Thermodesulfobacteriota bacterium]
IGNTPRLEEVAKVRKQTLFEPFKPLFSPALVHLRHFKLGFGYVSLFNPNFKCFGYCIQMKTKNSWQFVKFVSCICFFAINGLFNTLPALAEEGRSLLVPDSLNDLLISGDNTLRHEHYNTSGDEVSSLYQFEGPQTFNQFNLNMNMRTSPYSKWSGKIYGVINESDYRVKDRGFVPERLNLMYEKGDTAIPFRIETGDYYHYYTQRTIQRSLKGIQLELQPKIGTHRDRSLSIQFAAGAKQSTWKDFRLNEDLTRSMSFLFEDRLFGNWNLNYVHNTRKGKRSDGTLHRSYDVFGLLMERVIPIGNQYINIEAEYDYFSGDHDGVSGVESGKDRAENALFFQLKGKSDLPLTYRLRFEDYGQDFRPNGAAIPPDRRTGEGHVGWRFNSGLKVKGRYQHFRDGVETADPVDTDTFGVVLSGPLLAGIDNNLTGNINAYVQDVESRNKASNKTTQTINASFNRPLFAGWNGQVDIYYQNLINQVHGSNDSFTRMVTLSADHDLKLLGFEGNVRPGVMIRQIDEIDNGTDDLFPKLAVNLRKGNHSFGYNMEYSIQNRRVTSSTDIKTLKQNFNYRYTTENNTFGVEINSADRNPDPGSVSKSLRVAVFWTHQIGKTVRLSKLFRKTPRRPSEPYTLPLPSTKGTADLSELSPGVDMETIKERLARAKITGAYEQANLTTYEVILLDEIDQRQRLALVHEEGKLQKAALIIEFDDVGNLDDLIQTFERVRKELMDRYGNPIKFFDKGEFSATLVDDISRGKFIRIMEWSMPGGIIRYGIPRRLDGQIRMEVQFADSFPPESDTLWSIDNVK